MTEILLRYDLMIEAALRSVVRETIGNVIKNGLPGEHHFYITFLTNFPGVEIPQHLKTQYPEEMTIVLQYQFFGLKLLEDAFTVTLSFNNVKERLVIPLEAITTFADPSVNFALQFQTGSADEDDEGEEDDTETGDNDAPPKTSNSDVKELKGEKPGKAGKAKDKDKEKEKEKEKKPGEVISLDMFRKK